jgi:hypothetical protein
VIAARTGESQQYRRPTASGLFGTLGLALFFLMLFLPTAYSTIKLLLLAPLGVAAALALRRGLTSNLHPTIAVLSAVYVLVGIFFVGLGLLQGAPGALRVSTVYVLWPAAYTLLLAGAARADLIPKFPGLFAASTLAIAIYALTFVFAQAGLIPRDAFVHLDQGESISFNPGFIQFNLYSLASLLFLVPYLVALIVFLSMRRGLILVVALSPLVAAFLVLLSPAPLRGRGLRRLARSVVITAIFLFGAGTYGLFVHSWSPEAWTRAMISGYDVGAAAQGFALVPREDEVAQRVKVPLDPSTPPYSPTGEYLSGTLGAEARGAQFRALVDGWLSHPIFGAGLGATAAVTRSRDQPWAYELSYLALLFQTGVVGFVVYSAGVMWVFWRGLQIVRSAGLLGRQTMPVLTGSACFIAANATNPYLSKFDYLWVLFLPIALVNLSLLERSSNPRPVTPAAPVEQVPQ